MLTKSEGSKNKMFVFLKHALVLCGFGAASLLGLPQSSTVAFIQSAPESEGLSGILGLEPPEGLWEEDFLTLGDTWNEWSVAAAQDVAKLYREEPTTIAEQQAALDAIKSRLRIMKVALDSPDYSSIHPQLARLHSKLEQRYEFATAILGTLQLDPAQARQKQLSDAKQDIVTAYNELVSFLEQYGGGLAWLDYLDARDLAAKIADLNVSGDLLKTANPIAGKIASRNKLESDAQKKFLSNEAFLNLQNAIVAYRKINATKPEAKNSDALRTQLAALVESLEEYDGTGSSANAKAANNAFAEIQKLSPDQGELISAALRAHYFNYNLTIVASEDFLNKIIHDHRTESGAVRDQILGANVYGNQQTTTDVGVDVRPNDSGLTFDLVLTGWTYSNTAGVTSQATIYTSGQHSFRATKEINFDGDQFLTSPAQVGVNANNQTVGASTKLDGVPLFGPLAKSVAKGAARKKRYESEAIARSKISGQVGPQFDEEVDKKFATANEDLQNKFFKGLRDTDLYPTAMRFSSSESYIRADTRTMQAGELGGSRPVSLSAPATGAVVNLHESAANNTFDKLGIAGKTMNEDELADHLEKFFSDAFGVDLSKKKTDSTSDKPAYDETKKNNASFVFADEDPLRIQFDGDQVILRIRAGLRQEGEEDIPTQEISVPLTFTVQGDKILAESGPARVSPVERPENLQIQIARAGIIRKKISSALPTKELDGNIELEQLEESEAPPAVLHVREISSINGWLRLVLE